MDERERKRKAVGVIVRAWLSFQKKRDFYTTVYSWYWETEWPKEDTNLLRKSRAAMISACGGVKGEYCRNCKGWVPITTEEYMRCNSIEYMKSLINSKSGFHLDCICSMSDCE